ncbi:MAG: LysM peptidoglycan-binding domain-containing protein [Chloroflexi bacterium]|nr:LysM peptidoglycan-binding domain-containing protein [Chloroflexota bacterium]
METVTANPLTADMLKKLPLLVVLSLCSVGIFAFRVSAQNETPTPEAAVPAPPPAPSQVIEAINRLRMSYGIPPLGVHPVLMQVGQMQAEGIAGGLPGHWRPGGLTLGQWLISLGYPLSGDLSMDGYRSENWGFAHDAEGAIAMWLGDDEHTNTMLSRDRSDIGVGVAYSAENESYVVVVETALRTQSGQQQSDALAILTGIPQTQAAYSALSTQAAQDGLPPQGMAAVVLATALPDGDVYHDVRYGQTLWGIAIAYGTTIRQIQQLNGLADFTLQDGQRLLVKRGATQPAPSSAPQVFAPPTYPPFTPAPAFTVTPALSPQPSMSERERRSAMLGALAIGAAALFLGGLFTVMTRKKSV